MSASVSVCVNTGRREARDGKRKSRGEGVQSRREGMQSREERVESSAHASLLVFVHLLLRLRPHLFGGATKQIELGVGDRPDDRR